MKRRYMPTPVTGRESNGWSLGVRRRAGRHRTVIAIDGLEDDPIRIDVKRARGTRTSDAEALGRSIFVDQQRSECLLDSAADRIGE